MALCIAGQEVDDPIPMWRDYARSYPRTIREYDLGQRGDPGHLTPEEAWRSRVINSRLTGNERDKLVARAAEPDCPWGDVPENADLAAADPTVPGEVFDAAARLYWYFTWPEGIPGVRVAKVHKILHLKRPKFYPILDDRLRELYRDRASEWVGELARLEVTIEDSPPYWAAIRQDLLCNQAQLDGYRHELVADGDEAVAPMVQLTNLRLQDIVAWKLAG